MQINQRQLQQASDQGLISSDQAQQLWQFFTQQHQQHSQHSAQFSWSHILYYLGGMLAIGAMTIFMTLGWERYGGIGLISIGCCYALLGVALVEYFRQRQLFIPAGILATFVVALTPMVAYGIQVEAGWWQGEWNYGDYYRYVDWRWVLMELTTVAVAVLMLVRYRLPFTVLAVAFTLWFMSMDLAPLFMDSDYDWNDKWQLQAKVSVAFGALMLALALWVDIRNRGGQDFAFWLYLFGVITFWGGLTNIDSDSELGKLVYCLVNLLLIIIGAILVRRVFVVFGALGIAVYLGHLANEVFADSMMFPLLLTLIGFAIIAAGIYWQRHEAQFSQRLRRFLPASVQELLQHK